MNSFMTRKASVDEVKQAVNHSGDENLTSSSDDQEEEEVDRGSSNLLMKSLKSGANMGKGGVAGVANIAMGLGGMMSKKYDEDDDEIQEEIKRLDENKLGVKENLSLGPDIYSLAMFGFYLDDTEKKIFIDFKKHMHEEKMEAKTGVKWERSRSDKQRHVAVESGSDDDPDSLSLRKLPEDEKQKRLVKRKSVQLAQALSEQFKDFNLNSLKAKQQYRNNRNQQNFTKVSIIFGLQVILLTCILGYLIILPMLYEDANPDADSGDDGDGEHHLVAYVLYTVKFVCSLLLHVNC